MTSLQRPHLLGDKNFGLWLFSDAICYYCCHFCSRLVVVESQVALRRPFVKGLTVITLIS